MAARLPIVAAVALALPALGAAGARADDEGVVVQDLAYGEVLFEFFQEDYFSALTRLLAAQQRGELEHHGPEAELMLGGLYLSYGQHRLAGEIFERVLERAEGKVSTEATARIWKQYAVDTVYRFLPEETLFVGVRYNKAHGELAGITGDVGANRWQVGGGWFITPNVLAKVEYVNQKYFGYPPTNIRHGGQFKGMMLEGVVAF